jgi:outer membrane protein, multidrug efflux system
VNGRSGAIGAWQTGVALMFLAAGGCMVGPEYRPVDVTPQAAPPWHAQSFNAGNWRIGAGDPAVADWWRQFRDEELSRLIRELVSQSFDLAEARQRIVAAQAVASQTRTNGWPQLDGTANGGVAGTGEEGLNFAGPAPGHDDEIYSTGLLATWELDLWGRVERLTRAADAEVGVAVEDYHGAVVSLAADLALAYIDMRTIRSRLEVLDRDVELQVRTVTLAQSELDAGTGTSLNVAQAQRQLAQSMARRFVLLEAIARSENRIALLLGRRPGEVQIAAGGVPQMPPIIGTGLPAELIERRSDIRRAVAAYRAAVERIGAAEAEKYPSVTLSGVLSVQSTDIDRLFAGHAYAYNIGPALRVPLLDGGRTDAEVRERMALAQVRRVRVEQTFLVAIGEVENAAVSIVHTEGRRQELSKAIETAKTVVDRANELYHAGLTDFLQVVDAQRQLANLEDDELLARRDALRETVQLYRALGGGWKELLKLAPEAQDKDQSQVGHGTR